ncbi:hypothetical protein TNCV_1373831 [Trichonephila clavipes]|nr:hypothetical protein TNCV_1373831 [Trichonephila clavipes]
MRATIIDPQLHLMDPKLFFRWRGPLVGRNRPLEVYNDHFGNHWPSSSRFDRLATLGKLAKEVQLAGASVR